LDMATRVQVLSLSLFFFLKKFYGSKYRKHGWCLV
jgi:hypothetical protein